MDLPHSDDGNLMGVLVRVVSVGLGSECEAAAAFKSSVIVGVGCPAGPVTVTAAWPCCCATAWFSSSLAAVMLPSFFTCNTNPSLFWVMTMSLLSSKQSSSSNSSCAPSVCSPLSCLDAAELNE